jgi:hypothetical protein
MKTVSISDCCSGKSAVPIERVRYLAPELALSHANAFHTPIHAVADYKKAIDFKCAMQRRGGDLLYDVKVGGVRSPSPVFQGIQAIGSSIAPGNTSVIRSPIRSGVFSALTPGGMSGLSRFGATKPERGYRCPEGYQYGGRFTDSRLSTCGKQLFDVPGAIGQAIGRALARSVGGAGTPTPGRRVGALAVTGELIQSRAPQIPKVGSANRNARRLAVTEIVGAMSGVDTPYTRMVRRDGFVLEPVVSAGVLRTVPDNRDMEGATYITTAFTPENIGVDELGLLSNTGIEKLTYVLSGGSTLSIEKARPLTVGERRKLGKTVNVASKIQNEKDPASRLRYVASEMGDGIRYTESFPEMSDPNEIVEVRIPGSGVKTRMRRWVYESFYRKGKKKKRPVEVDSTQDSTPPSGELIDNLSGAVRHLNANGSLEFISPSLRSEALKRSQMYKTGKIKNGVILHERADGQTVFEITPTERYEHLGASLASELQRSMGLIAPKVRIAGKGERRSYLVGEAQDAMPNGSQSRTAARETMSAEDMLGIAISDWLLDSYKRNPSNIAPVVVSGKMRAVASMNPMAGLAEGSSVSNRKRTKVTFDTFFSEELRDMYRNHFEKLQAQQRRKAIALFEKLIDRAQEFDFKEVRQRLAIDGQLSTPERTHLQIVEGIYKSRLDRLKSSRAMFLQTLGLK